MPKPVYLPEHEARLQQRRQSLEEQLAQVLIPKRRLILEVGSGHGHFLTAYAMAHPEHVCIGIDMASDRIERALRKRDRAALANLFFLRTEARFFLETLPAWAAFSAIFILFPDPWPKLRHHKHRILQSDFLSALAEHSAADAHVYFRTDFQPYHEEAARVFDVHADWKLCDDPWAFELETVFQARAPSYHSLVARRARRQEPAAKA